MSAAVTDEEDCSRSAEVGTARDLVAENVHLRAKNEQLAFLARDNVDLVIRVAELEAMIEARSVISREAASNSPAKGGSTPIDGAAAAPARKLLFRERPQPGSGTRPRVLVIGPAIIVPKRWKLFGQLELTDVLAGLGTSAESWVLTGALSDEARRDLHRLKLRYSTRFVEMAGGIAVDRMVWQRAVECCLADLKPRIAIFVDLSPIQHGLLAALRARGVATVVLATHNEVSAAFPLPSAGAIADPGLSEMLTSADLVLVSSSFEENVLVKHRVGTSKRYDRGVDLKVFCRGDAPLPAGPATFLYVADRGGAYGLAAVRHAARLLEDTPNIGFLAISGVPVPESRNLRYRPLPARNERKAMYAGMAAVIIPMECTGHSQTLLEALALGLTCLVPRRFFENEIAVTPALVPYEGGGQALADSIRNVLTNGTDSNELRRAAIRYASTRFSRSVWEKTLLSHIKELIR